MNFVMSYTHPLYVTHTPVEGVVCVATSLTRYTGRLASVSQCAMACVCVCELPSVLVAVAAATTTARTARPVLRKLCPPAALPSLPTPAAAHTCAALETTVLDCC
jgi:hypothetical protein